jgi:hypothetical protein
MNTTKLVLLLTSLIIAKLVLLLTSLIIAGEALGLLIGMHILSERNNPWISFKNDMLLILDIVSGIALAALALRSGNPGHFLFLSALGLTFLTHGFRDWEYLTHQPNPFCANLPLFVFNNLKLAGLFSYIILSILH